MCQQKEIFSTLKEGPDLLSKVWPKSGDLALLPWAFPIASVLFFHLSLELSLLKEMTWSLLTQESVGKGD